MARKTIASLEAEIQNLISQNDGMNDRRIDAIAEKQVAEKKLVKVEKKFDKLADAANSSNGRLDQLSAIIDGKLASYGWMEFNDCEQNMEIAGENGSVREMLHMKQIINRSHIYIHDGEDLVDDDMATRRGY